MSAPGVRYQIVNGWLCEGYEHSSGTSLFEDELSPIARVNDLLAEQATIARVTELADQWENDADSWDGPAMTNAVTSAHAYVRELRAAIEAAL